MRAITYHRYGGPAVLTLAEVPEPTLGDKDVLVRVRASSVNPGDLAFVTGRPHLVRLMAGLRAPRKPVPGKDFAGVVEAVGARVAGWSPGDEVYGEAGQTWAELVRVKPRELFSKPARLTFEQAAGVPLAGTTAWQAFAKIEVLPGQRVLVVGASGGVGHFAVQIAKAQGAHVTAVCSGRNAELVARLGADRVIDYTTTDFTRLDERYDVIVDVVITHPLAEVRQVLAPEGVYVSLGTNPAKGPGEGGLVGPMRDILGVSARSLTARPQRLIAVAATPNGGIAELSALIESGAVTPHVADVYPLAEAAEALRRLATHHVAGKLAITI